MSTAAVDPLFPPDLERVIFELAASSSPFSIHKLMLVAWRVKEWIEPLRYHVAVASSTDGGHYSTRGYPQADISQLLLTSPSHLHRTVRHLCLANPHAKDTLSLLSNCPNVQSIWGSGPELKQLLTIQPRRLTRLHLDLERLFRPPTPPDFTHRLFSHITHLEIFDRPRTLDWTVWSGLASLPHLTHLAFNSEQFIYIFPDLLHACRALRVLALVVTGKRVESPVPPVLLEDVRFVWMICAEYVKDWHAGAFIGRDFWTRAEEFIHMRRTGEVDRLQYRIEQDETCRVETIEIVSLLLECGADATLVGVYFSSVLQAAGTVLSRPNPQALAVV
ncbi:hypothetical protein FB45DRAFT_1094550 [Roridomyces roridus]|uniref:Uncharacterized protein n=1 Tax=Roridomyces roridus TaxID=1738132 RepID=A0AAD7BGT0_9AGAR|nr:hypothetical protein FB45DRAFT_1094550 [Roridomyces roridus]